MVFTVTAKEYPTIYWNAHAEVIMNNKTPQNSGIPYRNGLKELFIKWWWDDYGVVLDHKYDHNNMLAAEMTFASKEDWEMFRLRWL